VQKEFKAIINISKMHLVEAIIHGLIWSILWALAVIIMMIKFPASTLKDYPKEIQDIAVVPKVNKKQHKIFAILALLVIFSYYVFALLSTFYSIKTSFLDIVLFSFVVFLIWNLVDLVILDWIILCSLQLKFMILPQTQGHKQYKNYFFHFVNFCKGLVYSAIFSLTIGGLMFLLLTLLVWK
jgi:small-conductance mechanosensitive channel